MIAEFLQRHKAGVLMIFFVSFSLLCLSLRIENYVVGLKTAVWFLVSPQVVYSGEFFNKLDSLTGRFFQLIRVEGENYVLREQNARLAKWKAERDALEDENNRLRAILALKQKQFPEAIVAEVVSVDITNWFHSMTINKGANEGITLSAAVVAGGGDRPVLVGRIVDVKDHTSKILLITDPLSAISVLVARAGNIGLLEGRNRPWALANYLSQRAEITEGDDVLTVGLSGVFPPGIPVGHVLDVSDSEDGFFKQARVIPYADFGSLREVMVLQRRESHSAEFEP